MPRLVRLELRLLLCSPGFWVLAIIANMILNFMPPAYSALICLILI